MNTQQSYKRNDNIYIPVTEADASMITGFKMRPGFDKFIIADGEIVNLVSNGYNLIPNEQFFGQFETLLDNAGIQYSKRASNYRNQNFKVDYILEDDAYHVNIGDKFKNAKGVDTIKPMLTAINSYDGSVRTVGGFSGFRKICENGLHVAHMKIGFSLRKRGANTMEIIMPKIEELIAQFMDNEYYTIQKKFNVLAEGVVPDINEFVKYVLGKTGLAKYEKSEKNPDEPSKIAQQIIDTIQKEAGQLGATPNLWLGYNAFNEYIHGVESKPFFEKERADKKIFNTILEMVN
jgi:hypothetical protein